MADSSSIQSWVETASKAVGVLGALVAVFKYVSDRRRELRWRRFEFLFQSAKELDGDERARPFLRFCNSLEDVDSASLKLALTKGSGASCLGTYTEFSESFEFVLKFFTRMRMAIDAGTISLTEARIYTGYLAIILQTDELRAYCKRNGFDDILHMAHAVCVHAAKDVPSMSVAPTWASVLEDAKRKPKLRTLVRRALSVPLSIARGLRLTLVRVLTLVRPSNGTHFAKYHLIADANAPPIASYTPALEDNSHPTGSSVTQKPND